MKKSALGLMAMLLGGCIFLTPPTGLRVGDHSQEFANLQQQTTTIDPAQIQMATYDGPDFTATYPKDWGEGKASNDFTGASTTRFSAGVRTSTGESEGLVITTINAFQGQPWTNEELGVFVKGNLTQGAKSAEIVAEKTDVTLGGEKANRIEIKSVDAQNVTNHMLAYSLMHEGRGWVIVISTLEGRWAPLLPVFERMVTEFKWKAGTASPAPASPGTGAATGSAAPTSPVPSGSIAPDVPLSPAPIGSPTASPAVNPAPNTK